VQREVSSSSPWDPVTGHVGMVQRGLREGSDWKRGSVSLPRGWSFTGTGLLERWLMPRACQCLRGVWTMPLIIILVSPEVVWQLDQMIIARPFQLFYSILFYSILFYSILFYSILFYSILFYSISILSHPIPFRSRLAPGTDPQTARGL